MIYILSTHLVLYSLCIYYTYKNLEICILELLLILINSLSLINILLINPGYLSKKFRCQSEEENIIFINNTFVKRVYVEDKWMQVVKYKDIEYLQKYCEECNIFKHYTIHHCAECNMCVSEMDHHCYWLNVCIGQNNIKFFYIYLYSIFVVYSTVVWNLNRYISFEFNFWLFLTILILLLDGFFVFLVFFVCYYIYLSLSGIRSLEFIKNMKRNQSISVKRCLFGMFKDEKYLYVDNNLNLYV